MHEGYEAICLPSHPYATTGGVVLVHRLIAEEQLGRYLTPEECVHHVDEIKTHNTADNLWVFKTNGDHTRYHLAKRNNLDYTLQCINGVYTCRLPKITELQICPQCKGVKSKRATLCQNCRKQYRQRNHKIDKMTLAQLLPTHSYLSIGKMFGISGTGVIKIAKRYGLYNKCYAECPSVPELMRTLQCGSTAQAAEHFGVSADTIHTWIKNNNITIVDPKYVCVETNTTYDTIKDAAMNMFPDIQYRSVCKRIKHSYTTGKPYKGYHWIKTEKTVAITDMRE